MVEPTLALTRAGIFFYYFIWGGGGRGA